MNKVLIYFYFLLATPPLIGIGTTMDNSCYPYVDKVSRETALELKNRYGLQQITDGLLSIGFDIGYPLSEREARYLLITAIDLYLKNLNADSYLSKHFSDYPFNPKHVDIALFMHDLNVRDSFYPNPSIAGNFQHSIHYRYYKPRERYRPETNVEESYEEAKVILAASQFSDADLEKSIPFNKTAQTTIDRFAKEMRKKYNLEYWGAGYSPENISIQFSIFHPISVQEARKLILETTAAFIKAINQSPELTPYLDHHPFTRDDVEVGIYSHKKKTPSRRSEWPIAPDVEVVALSKDEIIYGFRDPGLDRHRITETFEEAQEQLCLGTDDKVAQFAEEVSHLNIENSIENLMKRSREGK